MLINASPRLLYEGVAGWRIQSWVKGAARNLLLGEAPGAVVGPDRRAGKRGLNFMTIRIFTIVCYHASSTKLISTGPYDWLWSRRTR